MSPSNRVLKMCFKVSQLSYKMFFFPPIVLGFPGSGSCFHLFAESEPSDYIYTFCSMCMSVCICTCDEVSGLVYAVSSLYRLESLRLKWDQINLMAFFQGGTVTELVYIFSDLKFKCEETCLGGMRKVRASHFIKCSAGVLGPEPLCYVGLLWSHVEWRV